MIVVAGASGTLGPLLVGRGEPVRVVTRDPNGAAARLTGVELMTGDVTRPEDARRAVEGARDGPPGIRSEEHTSELQSLRHLVCRLLLEKKKKNTHTPPIQNNKQKSQPTHHN